MGKKEFKIPMLFFLTILGSCTSSKHRNKPTIYATKVVDKPIIFGEGIISKKDRNVFNIDFTPDGRTAYFTLRSGDEKQKIFMSQFIHQQWTEPVVASFSTDRDECPTLTPDGKKIYFGSQRPIPNRESKGNFDMNIWETNWLKDRWSEPSPLPDMINKVQIEKEAWPSSVENSIFTRDGIHYFFATMLRGSKSIDMYQTRKVDNQFTQPVKIAGLFEHDEYWKSTPVLTRDGQYMIFNSYGNPDGKGGEDIYVSKRTKDGWTRAKNIGNLINTSAEEAAARFSPDGKYFFFSREVKEIPEKDGIWSIYYIETKYIYFEQLFEN